MSLLVPALTARLRCTLDFRNRKSLVAALLLPCFALFLSGCGMGTKVDPAHSLVLQGSMHGGQQPVAGARLQLYAVGTTGDASAATPLISATVTTSDGSGNAGNANANPGNGFNSKPLGAFTITGDYTCPTPTSQVYLVGTGGNPGLAPGTVNPALAMLAVLGPCGNLMATTQVQINELTTIASLAPIAPYMNGYATLGSASGDVAQFVAALDLVRSYTDTSHGTLPGPNLAPGYYASTIEVTTLADILAGCINSDGGAICQQLFTLATPPGGIAPTDTIGAAVDILKNPTNNAAAIFNLLAPNAPFQPTLTSAPAAWSLPIVPVATAPVISPATGSYSTVPMVTISEASPGATIYYTTDGSVPTQASAVYSAPFTFASSSNTSLVVRAFATAPNFGSSAVSSVTYTVPVAGTASALAFLTQPVNTTVNAIMPAIKVGLVDPYGTPHVGTGVNIQISLGANPNGGTITGTKSLNTISGGTASFTNLSIAPIGNAYTFIATSTLYGSVVSAPFNITPPPITFTMPGTLIGAGATLPGSFTLPSAAPAGGATVTLTSSNPAAITVSPATVQLNAGDTSGSFTYTSVGAGATTITASATGYGDGTTTETTAANFITLGALPTAPGASQNLAVTLSQPAPTGGLTVNLSSSSTAVATVGATALFAAGSTTSSTTIQAKTFGVSTITATATGYAPDSHVLTIAGALTLTQNLTVIKTLNASVTVALSPVPTSAVTLTLKSDNTSVATVPATFSYPANAASAVFSVNGAGVGTTVIHASAAGIPDVTTNIAVTGIVTLNNGTPGAGLYSPATLDISSYPAITATSFTITSSNPAAILLSTNPNVTGTASITVNNVTGTSVTFYEQGQGVGVSNSLITVTSPSYSTTALTAIVRASLILFQSAPTATILTNAAPVTFYASLGELISGSPTPCSATTAVPAANCALNPGTTATIAITNSTPATGTLNATSAAFTAGTNNLPVQFTPVASGTTTIALGTAPTGFTTTANTFVATVSQPSFTIPASGVGAPGVTTVVSSLALAATDPKGGVAVTVTSGTPGVVVVTTDPAGVGSSSVTLPGITGALPKVYFQGQNAGTSTITVSAPGYKSASYTLTVTAASVGFSSSSNLNVYTSDAPLPLTLILNVGPGLSCYSGGITNCFITAGTANTFPMISQDTSIATITDVTFAPMSGFATATVSGLAAGQTILVIGTTPAPFAQRAFGYGPSQLSIFVTQSKITTQPVVTGANLTYSVAASIAVPNGSPRTVTITSGNAAVAVISTNSGVLGSAVATIPNFTGGNILYYVQGISPGTTTLTVSAPGFTTTPVTLTVWASGVVFLNGGGTFATVTTSSPTTLTPYLAEINPATGALVGYCGTNSCSLSPGSSFTSTVTSSNTTTGTISTSQVSFTPANVSATTTFVPNEVGTSTLSITQPAGFTAGTLSSGLVTVSGPTIIPPDVSVGSGFYVQEAVALSESPATPRSMTVTLTDPTIGRLSTDPAVMGTATSLTFNNISCFSPYCSNGNGPPLFYVQALKPGYAKLTVTVHGYTPATATVAVYKVGFTLFSSSTSYVSEALPSNGLATTAGLLSLLDQYSQSVVSDCLASSPCNVNPGSAQPTFSLSIADPTIGAFAPVSGAYDPNQFFARIPYTGLKQGLTTFALDTQSAGLYNTTTASRRMGIAGATNKGDLTYALVIESHDIDAGVGVEVIGNQSLSATNFEVANGLQIVATIADPTIAVLSTSATTVGGTSISLPGLNYINNNFYVQGLKAGTTTITFTGGSYQSRTITVTVRPAGFVFRQFDFVRTINNRDQSITVTPAVLNDAGQWMANAQMNPQAGATLPVTSSNTAVDTIISSVTFAAGATTGTFTIHPVALGSTTLTLGTPSAPFIQPTTYQTVVATVQ